MAVGYVENFARLQRFTRIQLIESANHAIPHADPVSVGVKWIVNPATEIYFYYLIAVWKIVAKQNTRGNQTIPARIVPQLALTVL